MFNRYPLWKYIILIVVILIGSLYALPNLYGEYPAIQITGFHGGMVGVETFERVYDIFKRANIQSKLLTLEKGIIFACFNDSKMQLYARKIILNEIGKKNNVALSFMSAEPKWLKFLHAEPIKLGLDLRGGVHFLININVENLLSSTQEKEINTFRRIFHRQNIPYVSIAKISNFGLKIYFRNTLNRNNALEYLVIHCPDLFVKSDGSNAIRFSISDFRLKEIYKYAIQRDISVLRNRVDQLGINESIVQRQGFNHVVIEVPGIEDMAHAKEILGTAANLEFRLVNDMDSVNFINNTKLSIPIDSEIKRNHNFQPIILYKRRILSGKHIIDSSFSINEYNQPQVNILLDQEGGEIISDFSKNHVGKLMAILLVEYRDLGKKNRKGEIILTKEEEVINVASIQGAFGKNFRITGINNLNEARQLSLLLRSGELVAPVNIVEEHTIGPSMGKQNIRKGLKSCIFGLISSIVFMIVFYREFGVIAVFALIVNLVLIVGSMSLFGATLTMPGIAGILLTLVVAVDANVLINERIKEELRNGRSVQKAIYQGYKEAFSSIFDANATTMIKVIILYMLGSGSIKGFAVTTAIGIATSIFTAIFGTRAVVNLLYGNKKNIKKLVI